MKYGNTNIITGSVRVLIRIWRSVDSDKWRESEIQRRGLGSWPSDPERERDADDEEKEVASLIGGESGGAGW